MTQRAIVALIAIVLAAVPGITSAQAPCLPLPPPTGPVVDIASGDVAALVNAVAVASSGDTIRLADGTYDVREALIFSTPGVTLRSASGDRSAVIIDGGYAAGSGYLTDFLVQITASDVTIADLTLRYAYYHPIQIYGPGTAISGALIHNVRIVDPGEQAIKINPSAGGWVDDGTVECSAIELTDFGRTQIRNQCYTGGIDAHAAWGWTVRANFIRGFWCDDGLSEHGVHFWNASRDTVVEGNVIVDCARGIGFGLGNTGGTRPYPDNPYGGMSLGHIDGIIRNNFVAAASSGLFTSQDGFDTGIGLELARGTEVLHNTVASTQNPLSSAIEWRWANTVIHLANNLVTAWTLPRDGATATEEMTIDSATTAWFVDVAAGDLHLTASATAAVDAGVSTASLCPTDLDGEARDASPDVGADEVGVTIFSDGFESGDVDAWS